MDDKTLSREEMIATLALLGWYPVGYDNLVVLGNGVDWVYPITGLLEKASLLSRQYPWHGSRPLCWEEIGTETLRKFIRHFNL